jgi:hypothetical protein
MTARQAVVLGQAAAAAARPRDTPADRISGAVDRKKTWAGRAFKRCQRRRCRIASKSTIRQRYAAIWY